MEEELEFGGGEAALAVAQEFVEEALAAEAATQQSQVLSMDELVAQMGKNPLPDGYISATMTPNRKARRLARQMTQRRMNRYLTWRRTLESFGIDPDIVLMDKREKRKIKRLPPKTRTRTTTHNQRRRAAHERKQS